MNEKVTVKEAKKQFLQDNKRIVDDSVKGFVELQDVNKVYGNRVQAVFNFNLSVMKNEFVVLVGPSGCGKSTTLRMIAGLEEITEGKLYIDNVLANYLQSKDRDIAMVFQSYALYPNMTVFDNMGFGLEVRGLPKEEIKKKVFEAAEILDLGPYLDRRPKELSGGQMQRVALGRAIVRDAKLFLMDEPLSNLDAKLRVQMRSEIVKLHKNIGATTIYVTHDQTEAMTMADKIVIMNQGVIQQVGAPIDVYNDPANVFVATFIGNPPMNVIRVDLENGCLRNKNQLISIPKELVSKYKMFLQKRREFFEDLDKKSELVEEKLLIEGLQSIKKLCKRMSKDELNTIVDRIQASMRELSKKGFIRFDDADADEIRQSAQNGNSKDVISSINHLIDAINGTDLAIAGILKQFDSASAVTKTDKVVTVSKKKQERPLNEENREKIRDYLEKYHALSDSSVLVGIRPEDIYFSDNCNAVNKSEPIETEVDLVEHLGSDFCMHVNLFGSNIIVKRYVSEVVKSGEKVCLSLDLDKLKIFDPVSGQSINYTEIE